MTEIITTIGCTEGLFAAMGALVDEGDEVILIEPFYDAYPQDTQLNGGIPVYVPLHAPAPAKHKFGTQASEWTLNLEELEAAAARPKAKILIINNPMNAIGKVWTRTELEAVANIAKRYNLIVLSDEVYEWMTYDGTEHVRIASLPGMFDRTLTFGSAGKTFSVTGWKVGWVIGPAALCQALSIIHQVDCFCHGTPLQEAVAVAFEQAAQRNYFEELKKMYEQKRNKLLDILKACNLPPVVPQGSYFVLADISGVDSKHYYLSEYKGEVEEARDYTFCRWLIKKIGVGAIPTSAFCSKQNKDIGEKYVRFTFCKRDEVLDAAAERLKMLKEYQVK